MSSRRQKDERIVGHLLAEVSEPSCLKVIVLISIYR